MATEEAAKSAVAKEILRYFLSNPAAVDNFTEIVRWRLMQERVRRNVEDAKSALDWLTAQGYLSEEARLGTESLFHLNPARVEDAVFFVEDGPQRPDSHDKEET